MKKATKLLCGLLGVGLMLAGCATVSPIKNKDSELVFNGNSAVMINDSYLYFGNSFGDYSSFNGDSDYKNSAKLSYLARLEAGATLSAENGDFSPKGVKKVAGEVAVHEKSFMFALGDYIYYLTPNRKKFENEEGKLVQQYGYSTLIRSKLNGDKKKTLYTTSAEVTQIEVLKHGNKYYLVMLAGTDLIKFELGSKVKRSIISSDVTSVGLPETYQKDKVGSTLDWNGNIYYTKTLKDEDNSSVSGTSVKKVSIAGGEEIEVGGGQGKTMKIVGRKGDMVFYTCDGYTYQNDTNSGTRFSTNKADEFAYSEVSNMYQVYNDETLGYIYTTNSANYYQTTAGVYGSLTLNYENASVADYKILFVNERTVYVSTTSAIYAADLSSVFDSNQSGAKSVECRAVVKMADSSIYSGNRYAFDGTYIYYYAKLQELKEEDKEDSEEDEEEVVDEHYYMYRTKIGTNADESPLTPYELLSLVENSKRHTK